MFSQSYNFFWLLNTLQNYILKCTKCLEPTSEKPDFPDRRGFFTGHRIPLELFPEDTLRHIELIEEKKEQKPEGGGWILIITFHDLLIIDLFRIMLIFTNSIHFIKSWYLVFSTRKSSSWLSKTHSLGAFQRRNP